MNSSSAETPVPQVQIRSPRASSVIVQRIPADATEVFMQWQRDISAAAAQFPGYQTTEIYPPAAQQEEWVSVIHFDSPKTLQDWLESPKRAEWIAKLPCEIRDFRQKMIPAGFGAWFAGLSEEGTPFPHWKMALTVLVGLYPTVMLLSLSLAPYTQRFGMAVSILIGNICSVSFLEWFAVPFVINPLTGRWLRANAKEHTAFSLGGMVLIVVALGVMTFLFALAS